MSSWGNSMGGYGALKWGLNQPQHFSRIVALSAVVDLADFYEKRAIFAMPDFNLVFDGQDIHAKPLSLSATLTQYDVTKLPLDIYTACGEQDPLYAPNLTFSHQLQATFGAHYTWTSLPGDHDWDFWDQQLAAAFTWLTATEG